MVEQNAKEALRRCDRGYVLAQGQNRYVDAGDVLLDDEEVRQQFLGGCRSRSARESFSFVLRAFSFVLNTLSFISDTFSFLYRW